MFSAAALTQRSYTWLFECPVPSPSQRRLSPQYPRPEGSRRQAARTDGGPPVDGQDVSAKIGDKIVVSLRTKDPKEAKIRFQRAEVRLDAFFTAMRVEPTPLGYRDVVALAGDAYRTFVDTQEAKVEPDHFAEAQADFEGDVQAFMYDDLPEGSAPGMSRTEAEFLASLMLPDGGPLLAWVRGESTAAFSK